MLSKANQTAATCQYQPGEPLWKRVPTRDEYGARLSDFMMVIPNLSSRSPEQRASTIKIIHSILHGYRQVVVFADLNLKLNVLWISVRPIQGISLELSALIHTLVPEAKLVAQVPYQG